MSPGPSGAALAARRFFFGGTETVRSLASSLSPPEKTSGGAVEPASTLPSSPTAAAGAAPALGLVKSVSSSGSIGGEETGKGWAEMVSGGKGELPSLLAPVELHGRDGEGATHHVRAGAWMVQGY